MKKSLLLFAFLSFSSLILAEINVVFYKLEYNEGTGLFDCKMVIEAGSATTAAERLHVDAHFTIIAPTGTTLTVEDRFFPIYDNENYTGVLPIEWFVENSAINPSEMPGYDVYKYVSDLSSPSHYNNLESGEEITLFSLQAVGSDICSLSLRLLENFEDPTEIGGIDYSNIVMIGSSDDLYSGNFNPDNLNDDVDVILTEGSICLGECITIEPSFNCVFPGLTYQWSTGDNTESITVCPEFSQEYILFLNGHNGYSGEATTFITVDPAITTFGKTDLCVGESVNYLPNAGIWSSDDESIVTVSNTGLVTPVAAGTATITHTSDSGLCSDQVTVTVTDPIAPTILGDDEICVGEMTQLEPTEGVSWGSSFDDVATITDEGVVTGISLGEVVFTYTTNIGQCVSETSPTVIVLQIPDPEITGEKSICVSQTTTLSPTAGVEWESSDPSIATVDNDGNVTGVSEGEVTFFFTDLATSCLSVESEPIMILPSPVVELTADTVCQNDFVGAISNVTGGEWQITVIAGGPNVVTINEDGIIQTENVGVVSVQYISEEGCISDETSILTILPIPKSDVSSNSPICSGEDLVLTANPLPGANYTYQWTGPNGFSSTERVVTVPNAELNRTGTYILIASENGCESDAIAIDVLVEDCDPCDDLSTTTEWRKELARMGITSNLRDFEIGESLVWGRELEDFVYYNDAQQEIRLIKNTGDGFFEEEIVLFQLPYVGPKVEFDIVDIDQDGLKDIVTYQSEFSTGTAGEVTTIRIYKNLDNYFFNLVLTSDEEIGDGFFFPNRQYYDLDNQGYLDIIPYFGAILFTEDWEPTPINLPDPAAALLIVDFNLDGYLDILGDNAQLFINNGNRTFLNSSVVGAGISSPGLYDSETGVFTDGYINYEIEIGDNPSITICWDPAVFNAQSFFQANINSTSNENGVIATDEGFYTFNYPLNCQSEFDSQSELGFIPSADGKIDIDKNGFSDFVVVEEGEIFVWINPNDQPKIRGTAFIDNNGDGEFNENDSPLRNVLISIEPGNLSVLTDDNGNYQFAVPEGVYSLTAKVNEGEWVMDELNISDFEILEPCNPGFDFGFVPEDTDEPSVNLSMVNTIARCDFETRFTITVENTGSVPIAAYLQFEFDERTTLFDVEFDGYGTIGNMVNASISILAPFQPQEYKIVVKMPGGSAMLPLLDFRASLLNTFGETIAEYGYFEQLRCSYDPNDKRTFPDREGDENLTLMDEDLEYTIRFQNNGNDTAYNVKIVDPLDANIDPSTIRVVSSSHEVETCIEGTDLIFLFDNIYLVDSTTDYASSQGYVTFKCNPKEGRAEFTEVNNTADIFFDTNPPITTNQTLNTLVSKLCVDQATETYLDICEGEEYMGYTETGVYTDTYTLPNGCDSLVTIYLTVEGITYAQQDIELCEAMEVTLGDASYFIDESTTIIDTMINDNGCISSILKYDITLVPEFFMTNIYYPCIDESISVPINLAGTWSSSDETVVQVDGEGNFTAISSGFAVLQFVDNATGCIDEIEVEVYPDPIINTEGLTQICVNESEVISSETEGIWITSDPTVATISDNGLIEGTGVGTVVITFLDASNGCGVSTEIEVLDLTNSNCLVTAEDLSVDTVELYPNPATGFVFLESEEVWSTVRLMNAQGQMVKSVIGGYAPKKQIDLNVLSPGLYIVMVEIESQVVIRKIIVD